MCKICLCESRYAEPVTGGTVVPVAIALDPVDGSGHNLVGALHAALAGIVN